MAAPGQMLREWLSSFGEAIQVEDRTDKEQNGETYYDVVLWLSIRPSNPRACPLRVVCQKDGYWGFFIDKWDRIIEQLHLDPNRNKKSACGMYREPFGLTEQQALEILQSVANGRVSLDVGVIAGRIVGTRGRIEQLSTPVAMHGIGWMPWLLAKVSLARLIPVKYEPWKSATSPS
jgi:hypothetical protein